MRFVLPHRIDQPRLADAGLADQNGCTAGPLGGARHHGAQRRELFFAADQRRAALATQRFETAQAFASPRLYGVDILRSLETFQRLRAKVFELEGFADQLARRRANDCRVFRCQRLQPRGLVQAGADDVLAIVVAGLLVDDDLAGGNADPSGEHSTGRLAAHLSQVLHDRPCRLHGAQRIVLGRARIAEIADDAIAEVVGDGAVLCPRRLGAQIVVDAQKITECFRAMLLEQCRRPDQVGKHHSQLPVLRGRSQVLRVADDPLFERRRGRLSGRRHGLARTGRCRLPHRRR